MNDYIVKILREGLQGDEYEIERSHRSEGPRPDVNKPPRVGLVKFLRYTAQQKVMGAAKERERNMVGGLYSFYLRRHGQGAFRPAETVLLDNENLMGASGETHTSAPGKPKVHVEGEELYRFKEG